MLCAIVTFLLNSSAACILVTSSNFTCRSVFITQKKCITAFSSTSVSSMSEWYLRTFFSRTVLPFWNIVKKGTPFATCSNHKGNLNKV